MKGFLKNTFLFGLIVVTINFSAEYYYSTKGFNPFWGSGMFEEKLTDKKETFPEANYLFLGPSIFYRQIDPTQFDKILSKNGEKSNSYNLSMVGLTPPEDLFLLEKVMEEDWAKSKTFFLSLTPIKGLSTTNLFKDRTSYYLNTTTLSLIFREFSESSIPLHTKIYVYGTYLSNYLYKVLSLSSFRKITLRNFEKPPKSVSAIWRKGFLALDDDPVDSKTNRNSTFLKEINKFQERTNRTKKTFLSEVNSNYKKTPHYDYIIDILEKAKEKDTKLIFVLPPRLNNYSQIRPLANFLPKANVIDLADPLKFPEFYAIDNSFDIGHLNKKGAAIFTERLAEEYLKKKNN